MKYIHNFFENFLRLLLVGLHGFTRVPWFAPDMLPRKNGVFQDLNGMNQLGGMLCIRSIHTVKSKEEAAEARLVDKKYLKQLDLHWPVGYGTWKPRPWENEVIDGMWPHETIQHLKVHGFGGDTLPNWLNPKDLQNLRNLEFSGCRHLETLSNPYFYRCCYTRWFNGSACKQQYQLQQRHCIYCLCTSHFCKSCQLHGSEESWSVLVPEENVESIPLDSITRRNKLGFLVLEDCWELSSIGGSGIPSSIVHNHVFNCPRLTGVIQHYALPRPRNEEEKEIKKWLGLWFFCRDDVIYRHPLNYEDLTDKYSVLVLVSVMDSILCGL
jgi:hypothetical protein